MKHYFRTLLTFLVFSAFALSIAVPAFAESRSATVRVSCTILPMLEVSSPKLMRQAVGSQISKTETRFELNTASDLVVDTNLGRNIHVSGALVQKPEGLLKLYSVTAL